MAMPNALDSLTEQTLQLAAAAAQLTGAGERIGRDASRVIAHEASAQARRAAAEAFADARAALDTHAGRVRELDATLQASRIATATMQRRWLVLAPAAAIAGCVLAVIGATAWVAKARSDVERHRVDAATLQAVQAADLVHWGDALCARTERGAAPNGYRRVAPRQAH